MSLNKPDLTKYAFAENAESTYISDIADESTESTLAAGTATMQSGFPPLTFTAISAGGIPPSGKDFNGILNRITQAVRYQQASGFYSYDSAFCTAIGGYPVFAFVLSTDGKTLWINTTDGNTTDPDGSSASGWKKLGTAAYKDIGTSGAAVPLLSTANTWSGDQTFSGKTNLKGAVEIYGSTPYIDFHFNNATDDYTSRIIESTKGTLSVLANLLVSGTMNLLQNGGALIVKPKTKGSSSYIIGKDANDDNSWFLGRGSDANYNATFQNYVGGKNRITLNADGSVGITAANSKPIGFNTETQSTSANSWRIAYGNYGAFWRNDGSNLYLMLTNSGDSLGEYNALRPFMVNLPTGKVTLANGVIINGGLTLGTALPIASGGTGSTTAAGARSALGCGTAAVMSYSTAAYTELGGSATEAASTKQLVALRDAMTSTYVSSMRRGTAVSPSKTTEYGSGEAPTGCVLTRAWHDSTTAYGVYVTYRPLQIYKSGAWVTISDI